MHSALGTLWEDLAGPAEGAPALEEGISADVLIVGAGFLGLSSALHAARAGRSVVLIEAEQPGFGASGRNTGFVVPSLKSEIGPADVEATLGPVHGERLLRLVAGSGYKVAQLVRDNAIDCNLEQTGWLQPAHSRKHETGLRERVAPLTAAGVEVEFIESDDMKALTGIGCLHGGLRIATGGQLNPLAYARGLARACSAAGVRLFANSPAQKLSRHDGLWHIRTPKGEVRAPQVLMTTNAMIGNLLPKLRDSIVRVRAYQIATNRLDPVLRTSVLPANSPVADTRRHTFALRWSPDGRLLTGGLVPLSLNRDARAKALFLERIRKFVPQVGEIRAEYVWNGTIAVTLESLPRLMELDEGLMAAIGCNGRGIALTTSLGGQLGALLAGQTERADFVLPITGPRPIPFGRWSGIGPHFWLPLSNFRDDREARND